MASKTLLVLGLAFAIVLLMASEVAAAKDQQASNQETQSVETNGVEDAKYGYEGRGGYNKDGCRHGCCGHYHRRGHCRCCSSLQEATAFKQTQAQTHN